MAREIVIDFKVNGLSDLKSQLNAVKGEMAGLETGSDAFNIAAEKAGELSRKIDDVNDAAKLAKEEGLFKFGEGFKQISSKIAEGDFGGAAKQISSFSKTISSINIKGLAGGFKDFIGTIGQLGKALLANPIFLIAAVIAGVIAAVIALKDKVKFLGDIFEFFSDIIGAAIQALKDFSDWLGLTSFAAEEKAQAVIDSAKKEEEAIDERYRVETALAQAAGEDVAEIQRRQIKEHQDAIQKQIDGFDQLKEANGELTEDQQKELDERKKEYEKYSNDLIILNAQTDAKIREDNEKAAADEEKAQQDRLKKWKEYQAARASAARAIRDLEISAIENETEQEVAKINERYNRLIEDTKKNEKLLQTEIDKIIALANANRLQDLKDFEDAQTQIILDGIEQRRLASDKEKDAEEDAEFELWKKIKNIESAIADSRLTEKEKATKDATDERDEKLKVLQDGLDSGLISQAKYNADVLAINEEFNIKIQALETSKWDFIKKGTENLTEFIHNKFGETGSNIFQSVQGILNQAPELTNALNTFSQIRIDKLQEQREKELDNENLTEEQKLAINKKFAAEQDKLRKKIFRRNKALQLTEAVINTAKSVSTALANPPGVPFTIPLGILAGVLGTAQIAKIASQKFEGEDVSVGGSGGAGSIGGGGQSFNPQAFTPNLFATGQQSTTTIQQQSQQNQTVVRAVVVETDITSVQNRIRNYQNESVI